MKAKIYFLTIFLLPIIAVAQNVGIGTNTPQSRLEVTDTSKTVVKIASKHYKDTSQLILSNRTAINLGTDMIFSANKENGIRITSQSDLGQNNHDSILTLTPQGRVGINNTTPTEQLDIRGNMNLTGSLKANGNPGSPNQILMQDGLGNVTWGDLNGYKNFETFTTPGAASWTVPAGVTEILVEVTGAGSGGTAWGGGAGGGYIMGKFTVTPGTTVNYVVGAGSAGTTAVNSTEGGSSSFSVGSITLTGQGGLGSTFNNTIKSYNSAGGTFYVVPTSFKNFIGIPGKQGLMSRLEFQQKSATSFFEVVSGGNGGGPGYCRTCTSEGIHLIYDLSGTAILRYSTGESRTLAGTGGNGGYFLTTGGYGGGGYGRDGIVIIRY